MKDRCLPATSFAFETLPSITIVQQHHLRIGDAVLQAGHYLQCRCMANDLRVQLHIGSLFFGTLAFGEGTIDPLNSGSP